MNNPIRCNIRHHLTPQFSLLSESQIVELHFATLEVLQRTGVRVFSPHVVDILRAAGCSISDGNLAKIPVPLVEQALRSAPHCIHVCSRDGQPAMNLGGTNVYYGTGSDLPNVIDIHTGERRASRKADITHVAQVCDALNNIAFVMSMALPNDVPVDTSDLHSFEAMARHTTKPLVYTAHDRAGLATIIEMAEIIAGGAGALRQKPFLILYAEPTTPLQHSREALEKLCLIAEKGLPVAYVPGSVTGASTPVTMAGSIIVTNAELLSGLVIAQLVRPGTPCIFGSGTGPLDMRTMVATYSAPEFMLMTSAMAEMGRYYGLPTWGFAGCSDSKTFDQQASLEGALWVLMAALSGANLVHDVGYLESGLTCSLEMLITMDETIGMVRRLMGGIEVNPISMALDIIHQIGPGGNFFATEHTLTHYREYWFPSLLDRWGYTEWVSSGSRSLGERAAGRAREILSTHQPAPLPAEIGSALGRIIARAEDRS